ncbi:MAG TPA: transcription antitermination factor NusB, partial [Terriglobales bacterium]|nr:transcription antitermination factor NusB [Terriglobales bacterium]
MVRELGKVIVSGPEIKPGARRLAAEILLKVDSRKVYADILLDNALRIVSTQDRALLTEIVYGTLRWRSRIDAYLKPLTRRPLQDTDPFLLSLLRLAVYQIVFLDRVPAYAALNEAVEMAKRYAGEKAGGFVNGVLRQFLRQKKTPSRPRPETASTAMLAEYWSHPDWLVEKWMAYAGRGEIEDWLRANNEEAPLVLRANLLKGSRMSLLERLRKEGIEASPTLYSPQGLTLHSRVAVDHIPGCREGLFQVQGESSQLVTALLAPEPGESILDACAAPGGKTTHI